MKLDLLTTDVFTTLLAIYTVVTGSLGVGSGIAFLIQLGKLWLPKLFTDNSAQNFRIIFNLLVAVFLFLAPTLGLGKIGIDQVDAASASFATLGLILMPVFIWLTDLFAKKFYSTTLRGLKWVGRSYTLETPTANSASPDPTGARKKPA